MIMKGSSYASAAALPTEAGPQLLNVTDSAEEGLLLFDGAAYIVRCVFE